MRCVVTGGSGFIGSHVMEALTKAGHAVTGIDLNASRIDGLQTIPADILDTSRLVELFTQHGQDAVFHIAAIANARAALDQPVKAIATNVQGTASVLEAARRAQVKRVILASTVWYYNATDQRVDPALLKQGKTRYLDETEPILPQGGGHVYTTSKIASELLCHDFHRLCGLNFTILRYGIPYGPRMWPGLALRTFVESAWQGKPIVIFGDGSAVRRFLYVGDLADAHVRALSDVAANQTYNLEGDRDVTVRELAETVGKFVPDVQIKYLEEPTRRGELQLNGIAISNQKARQELGWRPSVELEDGVRQFVEWYRDACGQPIAHTA